MSDELIQELEDLADEWGSNDDRTEHSAPSPIVMGKLQCADDLRELIADYGDTDE